jgi:glycosyltransferase involved in cell wall biosynthesis
VRRSDDAGRAPAVSVVIPAHNAARTIGSTLDSLIAQTSPAWEAIVVDDGSSDDTRSIADAYARRDPRIGVCSVDVHSEAAARNAGIDRARGDLLAFLDADDLLHRATIASVIGALERDPSADGVVFGWASFGNDGEGVDDAALTGFSHWEDRTDQFLLASSHTPFPVHACVIRRALVSALGAFDPSVSGAADWDLWMRVFRSGARLVRIGATLALYRVHPSSMSRDTRRMFGVSLRVLERAYRDDPRVTSPDPRYRDGAPASRRRAAILRHLCWWAGVAIGNGEDPRALLAMVADDLGAPGLTQDDLPPHVAAFSLARPLLDRGDRDVAWAELGTPIRAFLERVEEVTRIDGLAWRTLLLLVPPGTGDPGVPRRRGDVRAADVELTEPIPALEVENDIRCVLVVGRLEGRALGLLELDVTEGVVPAQTLHDAVGDEWFWDLSMLYLERSGAVPAGSDNHAYWGALVDELWRDSRAAPRRRPGWRRAEIVLGERPPRLVGPSPVDVRLRVGRTTLHTVRIGAADARSPSRLTRAVTLACGDDLLRAVAREALVGRTPAKVSIAEALRTARTSSAAALV